VCSTYSRGLEFAESTIADRRRHNVKWYGWVVFVLAALSGGWCVLAHVWIAFTPLWHQGLVQGAVFVPTVLAMLATWAAWRRSRVGVGASALLFAGFTFVTGFSIGNAYVPAAGLLILAAVLAASIGFGKREREVTAADVARAPDDRWD
jgi:FtsH-binding integral membrane protein